MTFDAYQIATRKTAVYPEVYKVIYPAMGLAGESGEAIEKVKKAIRLGGIEHLDKDGLAKEMGDVLWYLANLATDLGMSLEKIAWQNLEKLSERKVRGVLKGEGDER